jgi:hypothetical protein
MLLGFFMPLLVKILSFGFLNWMACLTFDAKGTVYRTARKHELYQFSDVTEKELSWIAWGSLMVNLFFGFIAYLINAPIFSYINFSYAMYNLIPISNLDGAKIYFGNQKLWAVSAVVALILLIFSLTII